MVVDVFLGIVSRVVVVPGTVVIWPVTITMIFPGMALVLTMFPVFTVVIPVMVTMILSIFVPVMVTIILAMLVPVMSIVRIITLTCHTRQGITADDQGRNQHQ